MDCRSRSVPCRRASGGKGKADADAAEDPERGAPAVETWRGADGRRTHVAVAVVRSERGFDVLSGGAAAIGVGSEEGTCASPSPAGSEKRVHGHGIDGVPDAARNEPPRETTAALTQARLRLAPRA